MLKNPTLISQINKAALITQPYQLRMREGQLQNKNFDASQMSTRSIKSKAFSNVSRMTMK
jgi:hypothetical protein